MEKGTHSSMNSGSVYRTWKRRGLALGWCLLLMAALGAPPAAAPNLAGPRARAPRYGASDCITRLTLVGSFDPKRHMLSAGTVLRIHRTSPSTALSLMLYPGFRVDWAAVGPAGSEVSETGRTPTPVTWRRQGARMTLLLPRGMGRAADLVVVMDYHGIVHHPGSEDIGPSGAYLFDESAWHPANGQVIQAIDFRLTMPASWRVASMGDPPRQVGAARGLATWMWTVPFPASGVSLAAGPYGAPYTMEGTPQIVIDTVPGSRIAPKHLAAAAARAVAALQARFGPFPYPRLVIAESGMTGGNGISGLVMVNQAECGPAGVDADLLAHEISHSWWAGVVPGDSSLGLWFEALAEETGIGFANGPWLGSAYAARRRAALAEWTRIWGRRGVAPAVADVRGYEPWVTASEVIYTKGAFVAGMLRAQIGSAAYDAGLRLLVGRHAGELITWREVEDALAAAAGQPLRPFFAQWIDRPGAPSFVLDRRPGMRLLHGAAGWRLEGLIRQTRPAYAVRLPVDIVTDRGRDRVIVLLDAETARLTWSGPDRPRRVVLDPDAEIFRVWNPSGTQIALP